MAQLGGVPILILKEGTERSRGKDAREKNILAIQAVAEAVKPYVLEEIEAELEREQSSFCAMQEEEVFAVM